MGPFIDAANWVRGAVTDLWNGEKANDFEQVNPAEDPTRAIEAERVRLEALSSGLAQQQIGMVIQDRVNRERKEKQLFLLIGAGVLGYMLWTSGPKRKRRR